MLDFYRTGKGTLAPWDARVLIEEVLALNTKLLEQGRVTLKTEWGSDLPLINVVGDHLKQVFLNIILNAIEAMPNGGDLKIVCRMVGQQDKWLTIAFTDTGVGITPSNLGKIFEPFYTTKPNGTGLGLGISHNIITNHGGRLTVESVLGSGSTFTVWLPVR
jgi:signal transduction histidine kinase